VSLEQRSIVCVRKRIARPKQLKAQQKFMTAFAREIEIMRQVNHRHCVKFVGSYSDMESVNILSLPVADMDLATYLDRPIGDTEWVVLYKGIDCLCNGL
jgi:serine/threonine protein kinase